MATLSRGWDVATWFLKKFGQLRFYADDSGDVKNVINSLQEIHSNAHHSILLNPVESKNLFYHINFHSKTPKYTYGVNGIYYIAKIEK